MSKNKKTDADLNELARSEKEKELSQFAEDRRGGNFFIIDSRRIHESDLTAEQRKAVGLPPLPKETREVATDA